MESAPFERLLARLPSPRSPRFFAVFLLTAMACWGEPGARGAATPADAVGAPPAEGTDEAEPVAAPSPPPTPLPPDPASSATPTSVPRPAAAPGSLAGRLTPLVDALSTWVKTHHADLSLAVRDLGTGRELCDDGAARALNPASNAKLITAAVALSELGPKFRFHVGVLGKIEDGVAPRLVLRGNGDPSFSYEDLKGFAERLVALGLKRVDGGILVDQSAFDDTYTPPAFEQQPGEWSVFRAPVSAVALERNTTTLHVYPTEAGELARVEFEPPGYVSVQGEVRTETSKKREHVGLTLKPRGLLLGAQVSGGIPEGKTVLHASKRIENPEIYAGVVLARVLTSLGVDVKGEAKRGGEDESVELVGRDSLELAELTQQLGKASDNFYAETLFKALGAFKRGKPGTAENAARVEVDWLKNRQIGDEGLRISNGSGLYDANRVSARTFTRVLEAAYLDPSISRSYVAQLAVGGVDGTLRSRFLPLRGRPAVHAKTGTLNKVTSLSGYVFGPDEATSVAFSILISGTTDHAGARQRMDALVLEIADSLWASARSSTSMALARR
ncbi:MAG TPA: D-alanyl-D-alanine carboxypeptidase/D-alanyl-D-alanine-endopeptidase [Polyangiaceae bacterium]|nr:D-alanyl-D-alanine carboxypeptidase/D-alanyl-D-alanine-endopeptidase [Polyangiaceae bacterium]